MISVAMTSYNGEKFIEKQIESILNQTVKVDEIIIVDDGSIDGTVNLIKKYNVTLVQNEKNLGIKKILKKQCHYVMEILFFYVIKMIFGLMIKSKSCQIF